MGLRRYHTLDALRGLAAIAVVGFHISQVKLEPVLVPYGYLAVDFFFVLSGAVVAHAYEKQLRAGLSWQAFFVKRVIRLYPLALLGTALGLIVLLLKWYSFPSKVDSLPRILGSAAFNGLLLPTPVGTDVSRGELFPGNNPLWSLFFEMVANMFWALLGFRLKTGALVIFTVSSGVILALLACHFHTTHIGFVVDTIAGGFARVAFGFSLGVLIYRVSSMLEIPSFRMGPAILAFALTCALAIPVTQAGPIPWYPLLCIFLVLPAIVLFGIGQEANGLFGTIAGNLSYPVYVLHLPVLLIASGLHQTILANMNVHLVSACSVALVLGLGTAALFLYDQPIRRRLTRTAPTQQPQRRLLTNTAR